jgi:hypothetical protein
MGDDELETLRDAGRLIHWALQPRRYPAKEPEYRELLAQYRDHSAFRDIIQAIAAGFKLHIIKASDYGMVVVPDEDSVFAVLPHHYRPSGNADERLIDGLIQVAIIATIYPNAQDLEDDAKISRQPITVDDVATTLQHIGTQLEEAARRQPDPLLDDVEAGLYEAWRVYRDKTQAKKTEDGRVSSATIQGQITRGLNFLEERGCFRLKEQKRYQPTWRYQTMVQEWSASRTYDIVRSLLTPQSERE